MKIVSNIYEVKIRKGQNYLSKDHVLITSDKKWYAVRYITKAGGTFILIFDNISPGGSYSRWSVSNAKNNFTLVGEPLNFNNFKLFFQKYSDYQIVENFNDIFK